MGCDGVDCASWSCAGVIRFRGRSIMRHRRRRRLRSMGSSIHFAMAMTRDFRTSSFRRSLRGRWRFHCMKGRGRGRPGWCWVGGWGGGGGDREGGQRGALQLKNLWGKIFKWWARVDQRVGGSDVPADDRPEHAAAGATREGGSAVGARGEAGARDAFECVCRSVQLIQCREHLERGDAGVPAGDREYDWELHGNRAYAAGVSECSGDCDGGADDGGAVWDAKLVDDGNEQGAAD